MRKRERKETKTLNLSGKTIAIICACAVALIFGGIFVGINWNRWFGDRPIQNNGVVFKPELDANAGKWTGGKLENKTPGAAKGIEIPGYAYINLPANTKDVQMALLNPEGNPSSDYVVSKILLGEEDITSKFNGGYIQLDKVYEDGVLTVETTKALETDIVCNINLEGTVTLNGEALSDVEVELRSSPRFTKTDKEGKFLFDGVETGHHALAVISSGSVIGYMSFDLKIGDGVGVIKQEDGTYVVNVPTDILSAKLKLTVADGRIVIEQLSTESAAANPTTAEPTAAPTAPKTGENSISYMPIGLLALASITLASVVVIKRKTSKEK